MRRENKTHQIVCSICGRKDIREMPFAKYCLDCKYGIMSEQYVLASRRRYWKNTGIPDWESRAAKPNQLVKITCSICGADEMRHRRGIKYCLKCSMLTAKKQRADYMRNYKRKKRADHISSGPPFKITCVTCGLVVERGMPWAKYCIPCRDAARKERNIRGWNIRKANRPPRGPIMIKCATCGIVFEAGHGSARFCPPCRRARRRVQKAEWGVARTKKRKELRAICHKDQLK